MLGCLASSCVGSLSVRDTQDALTDATITRHHIPMPQRQYKDSQDAFFQDYALSHAKVRCVFLLGVSSWLFLAD